VGSSLHVFGNLINNGTISPAYDYFFLEVFGDFINNGAVSYHYLAGSHGAYNLHGNLVNNGSFRNIGSLNFKGENNLEHIHKIKCINDSTIYLGTVAVSDSMGIIMTDSVTRINGSINLNKSMIYMPDSMLGTQKLILDGITIQKGEILANKNIIYSKSGSTNILGNDYSDDTKLIIENATFSGGFFIYGRTNKNGDAYVMLKGKCVNKGQIYDRYYGSVWTGGDRALFINGEFINEGKLSNATTGTGWGLWLIQDHGSVFRNYTDSLNFEKMIFNGTSYFYNQCDTLNTEIWEGVDQSTDLQFSGNAIFRKNISIDMKGGTIHLPYNSKFKTTYLWYNSLRNATVYLNSSEITFASFSENLTLLNPVLNGVYFRNNATLKEYVKNTGGMYPYSYESPTITIEGDLSNTGIIDNHPSAGNLTLIVNGNIFHNGKKWNNYQTKLQSDFDQAVIIPNDSAITGKFMLYPMIKGTTYKWQKNGIEITGTTDSILSLNNGIDTTKYGKYQCIIDDTIQSRIISIGRKMPAAFEITDVVIKNLTKTSTLITWKTTKPACGFVFYAITDNSQGYPLEAMENHDSLKIEHQMILEDLPTSETIYFIIDQTDVNWNDVCSDEYSFVAGEMTGIQEVQILKPTLNIYPNPFKTTSKITYNINEASNVAIDILDVNGKLIKNLFTGMKHPGMYSVDFEATELMPGVYLCRLQSEKAIIISKMIIK